MGNNVNVVSRIVQDYDFTDLGLKVLDCVIGDKLKSVDYYKTTEDGMIVFSIEIDKPLLKVDSLIGVAVDIDADSKMITAAEVIKEEKTVNFFYVYTLKIPGVATVTSDVQTMSETSTQAAISSIKLLDYDHAWEKSETPEGNREYLQYFFDNTSTTDSQGENLFSNATLAGISNKRTFYEGNHAAYSVLDKANMFKTIKYPIIDFFHDEFIHVIENKSLVWMRKKAGGGVDKLTWAKYPDRNPLKADATADTDAGKRTKIPSTEYVLHAAMPMDQEKIDVGAKSTPTVIDRTAVQRSSNFYMQPTMAKFIGWPQCDIKVTVGGATKFSNADPFFFLKPSVDAEGNTVPWDSDARNSYPKFSFYTNGAHAIPDQNTGTNALRSTGARIIDGKLIKWCTHSPTYLTTSSSTGTVGWTPNAQEVAGFGSTFIPGDGNEYYNCKFWRDDGDSFSPALMIDSRQGMVFDNCDFLSIWDGYRYDYIGSTEVAPSLVIKNNSYDNVFKKCNIEVKTTQKEVIYRMEFVNRSTSGSHSWDEEYHVDNRIFGIRDTRTSGKYNGGLVAPNNAAPIGRQKVGYIAAAQVFESGNILFDDCYFKANYGQTCLYTSNADNVEVLASRAETYYHNTENLHSLHCDYNIYPNASTFYTNHTTALRDYQSNLGLYNLYIDMFGSAEAITAAYTMGAQNDLYNIYGSAVTTAAYNAYTSKIAKQTAYFAAEGATPWKTSEKYELKPKGFHFTNQSSSILVKGTEFFGEGIGFFADNCTNRHYLEFEDCRVDTYIDEGYLFRNVHYPKIRGSWGHTISNSVYKFESCLKPVQYDCTAESDTGFGYEYGYSNPTNTLPEPFATNMWRVYDCHVLSGSGIKYDPKSMPAKIDFGTFIQTANSTTSNEVLEAEGIERSLVGIKLYDSPYKATFRNLYFKNIKNDIDIYKGDNVELYLENAHFAANREIHGTYSSPAYFIHKGFSGVWEYRDIGGSITTSAVFKKASAVLNSQIGIVDPQAGFSLSFKSYIDNLLGRSTIVLGNSNDETQYLNLIMGLNKVTVYVMARLLDVEKPLTNQDIWLECRYKDRAPGDPHVVTATTRGVYSNIQRISEDEDHRGMWLINGEQVPNAKEYKIEMIIDAGQDCSAPLSICYEYFTTVGEIYVDPYASVIQLDNTGEPISTTTSTASS